MDKFDNFFPFGVIFILLILGFLFFLFGVAIPEAFTAPVPEPVEFVVTNFDMYANGLPPEFYVQSYETTEHGALKFCGYWDPPDHVCWDTGYDWVPNIITLSEGDYVIKEYPIVTDKGYCPEPK
jgi:hypothetical protein